MEKLMNSFFASFIANKKDIFLQFFFLNIDSGVHVSNFCLKYTLPFEHKIINILQKFLKFTTFYIYPFNYHIK